MLGAGLGLAACSSATSVPRSGPATSALGQQQGLSRHTQNYLNSGGFRGCLQIDGDSTLATATYDCSDGCSVVSQTPVVSMVCTDGGSVTGGGGSVGGGGSIDPYLYGPGPGKGLPKPGNAATVGARIHAQALIFRTDHSTKGSTAGIRGADAGNECVATIQQIRVDAGLPLIANGTNNVDDFRAALYAGDGTWLGVDDMGQAVAKAGDYVVQGDGFSGTGPGSGQWHIGICLNDGCSEILSNSTTNQSFTWVASPSEFAKSAAHKGFVLPNGFWRPKT